MENLIYIDGYSISPLALILCGASIVLISFLLAIVKDKWLGWKRMIYP